MSFKQVKLFFNLKKAHSNSPGSIIICKVSSFKLLLNKLCGNCGFPQNFHIGKLDEITVFYAVYKHLSIWNATQVKISDISDFH